MDRRRRRHRRRAERRRATSLRCLRCSKRQRASSAARLPHRRGTPAPKAPPLFPLPPERFACAAAHLRCQSQRYLSTQRRALSRCRHAAAAAAPMRKQMLAAAIAMERSRSVRGSAAYRRVGVSASARRTRPTRREAHALQPRCLLQPRWRARASGGGSGGRQRGRRKRVGRRRERHAG